MINLRILVPDSTTNYVKNPSFELDTTGWNTYGGADTDIFEDTFTRANGLIENGWDTTNSAWAIASNKAVATPTLGAELFTNTDFGSDTVWVKGAGWTIAALVATHVGGVSNITQAVATIGQWYKTVFDVTSITNGTKRALNGSAAAADLSPTFTTTGTKISTNRQASTTAAGIRSSADPGSVDNASLKLITYSDMFATRQIAGTAVVIAMNAIINTGTIVGVVGFLDSYTSPANYIVAYHTGQLFKVDKVVGGTITNLISSTVTAVSGAEIRLSGVLSGGSLLVDAFYAGTQIGAQQTVSDAGIVSNTRHGMFNTSELNSISYVKITTTVNRNSLATLTRSLDRARFGRASGKVVTNGDMLNEGVFYKVSWLNGVSDVLTASIYARGGGKIRLRLADATTGMNFISKPVSLNDERWTRLEVTGRCSGGNDVRLWVESANPVVIAQTFYIDGAQIERKSAATSYCDGEQDGCRWNVVANATISTRTADTREGGRWVPLAGPCRPNNDLYVTTLGGFGMPPIVNNIQSWANAPGSFFQNEKIQNRVVTFSFHVKKESFRTGGSAPSILALHELRQQLINLFKSDVTLNSQAFLFEYSDSETDKKLYIRMRYEAGLEGEWDIRNRWFNSFPVRMIAVDPLWSEDSQDVMPLVIKNYSNVFSSGWSRISNQWSPITDSSGVGIGAVGLSINKFAEAADGSIYIAGGFYTGVFASEGAMNRIVKWDGTTLSAVGPSGANNEIFAIAVAPDGTLYACGNFSTIGGVAAARVAKYSPVTNTWSAMSSGINAVGQAIYVATNGQVYVGGQFSTAGGITCNKIARWDGLQWRTVGAGSGFNGNVNSIVGAGDGETIYISGQFTAESVTGVSHRRVASVNIDTNLISQLGVGLGGTTVYDLCVGIDGTLYAGGDFTVDGDGNGTLLRVAQWSGGQAWLPMGIGFSDTVYSLAVGLNGEVYGGGKSVVAGHLIPSQIQKWYGGSWNSIEFPSGNAVLTINDIVVTKTGIVLVAMGFVISAPIEFPKTNTITNNGSASCWPILTVTGSGTLSYLSNVKTGQEIFLDLDVFSGETVTIDFARGKIESDTRGDLNYTLLSGSEIRSIYLLPGDNTISVLMNDDVNASMQLRWEPLNWSADAIVEAESL